MYNLIIAGSEEVWDHQFATHTMPSDRFLAFTDSEIRDRFDHLEPDTIAELCRIPTLFAYEDVIDQPAQIGKITSIEKQGKGIKFTFQIDRSKRPVSRDTWMALSHALGILDTRELSRVHWAVKDIDLLGVFQTPQYVKDYRVFPEANRIALKAARAILEPVDPWELSIANTTIRIEIKRLRSQGWPEDIWGLIEEQDGPWPQPLLLECSWLGGKTQILASATRAGANYRDLVSLMFSARQTSEQLVWINIAASLREGRDNQFHYAASFSLSKRIPDDPEEQRRREQRALAVKSLVRQSSLIMAGDKRMEAFEIVLPKGEVQPSPSVALRRLTHLALIKLPFMVRNLGDIIEGQSYVDPDDPALVAMDHRRAGDSVTETGSLLSDGMSEDVGVDDAIPAKIEGPALWLHPFLDLQPPAAKSSLVARGIEIPDELIAQLCAALSSGKHLLLVGPPGTGKTEIASALAHAARDGAYCDGAFVATASADWSTFDTIGGYTMEKDGRFAFRSGVFLRAIELRKWLLLDEVNRADIDRSFGELMTVLAGGATDTPFTLQNGTAISIGPGSGASHRVPPTFRLLATMNTWDKTSLFRLSYAVQRRFAIVHIGPPADAIYANILNNAAVSGETSPALDATALERMKRLFSRNGVLKYRPIGPAVAKDMVSYLRHRHSYGDGMAEAIALLLLPQLEGLDAAHAEPLLKLIQEELKGWASDGATSELFDRFHDLFPAVRFSST